jgi:hypothetical protein
VYVAGVVLVRMAKNTLQEPKGSCSTPFGLGTESSCYACFSRRFTHYSLVDQPPLRLVLR